MKLFETIETLGHEQVVTCYDKASGYKGIIAIHNTTLGPALGGTRFWNYASDDEAFFDVLRLSRGMTYKNAVAGLNLGGGKYGFGAGNGFDRRCLAARFLGMGVVGRGATLFAPIS